MKVVKLTKRNLFAFSSITLIILLAVNMADGRRGRGRGRGRAGGIGQIREPVGGVWKDPKAAKYYLNPKGAKIVKASHFDFEYVLGHKIYFLCVAKGTPIPHITWFKDGIELYSHRYLIFHEWRVGKNKIKSKMEIDPATQMDAGIYDCIADNKFALDKRTFRTDFITNFD